MFYFTNVWIDSNNCSYSSLTEWIERSELVACVMIVVGCSVGSCLEFLPGFSNCSMVDSKEERRACKPCPSHSLSSVSIGRQ